MPILKMFCVYDSKVEAYDKPFTARTVGEALRSWEEACNDGRSPMSVHPGDFTLFEIGEYDDRTGVLKAHEAKRSLGLAVEAKRQPSTDAPLLKNIR